MSEDFQPGSRLAGYWLEAEVGAGGMARVFRARDMRLDRLVALKILDPARAADSSFRQRFIAESRAAARVDDPHIIPVYEADEANGVLFIAMRFVQGGDLRVVLEREGPLSAERTVEFISPVASALDAAHAAGLVHRDVKPGNILVDAREGRPDHVYLSDFGIAKAALSSVSLTEPGLVIGTPDYSAPEQIGGLAVDGRADQYALACVTFRLLTGAPPFERDSAWAVMAAHLDTPPPSLSERRPDVPGAVDQVLAKGMAKTPDQRYESCGDFADALREALGQAPYRPGRYADVLAPPRPAGSPPAETPLVVDTGEPAGSPIAALATEAGNPATGQPQPFAGSTTVPRAAGGVRRRGHWYISAVAVLAAGAGAIIALVAIPGHGGHQPPAPTISPSSGISLKTAATAPAALGPTASPSSPATTSMLTIAQLQSGDCLTGTNLGLDGNQPWPALAEAVPCDQSHLAEVFFADDHFWAAGESYPGEEAVENQVQTGCDKEFAGYVGISSSESEYHYAALAPFSDHAWQAGSRSLDCVAYYPTGADPGGAPMTGSIRGTRR